MAITIGSGGSGGVFAPTVTLGAMLGAATGMALAHLLPGADLHVQAFVVVGMAAVIAGAARTPISTLIMVAEMTGSYGLIVPAMLANILAFLVQGALTRHRRFPPTLYENQVETREDSPLHRGVFVRRALNMIEGEKLDPAEFELPRLVSLLRFGSPIPVAHGQAMLLAVDVEPGSSLAGTTVAESLGHILGATAVAVLREEEMLTPRGDTPIEIGDRVLVVASGDALRTVERLARSREA
jgi:CIC family chloride channel protein